MVLGNDIILNGDIYEKSPPRVTLNGIDIPFVEQNFIWNLTPGVLPFQSSFLLDRGAINDSILEIQNPVNLKFEFKNEIAGQQTPQEIEFKNLIITERCDENKFLVRWKIADIRYLLRGIKSYFGYNITRVRTEKSPLNPPTLDVIGDDNPEIIRQQFDTFRTGRYLRNSVKANGEPFKMDEILLGELEKIFNRIGNFNSIRVDTKLKSGSYLLENIRADGEEFYSVFAELLKKNRSNLAIDLSGNLRIYSIDYYDVSGIRSLLDLQTKQSEQLGRIYVQDLRKIRPSKIRVKFDKLQEVFVRYNKLTSEKRAQINTEFIERKKQDARDPSLTTPVGNFDNRTAITCVNVIRIPFLPATSSALKYNIGEYVPISVYLDLFGFKDKDVADWWWNSYLEIQINRFLGSVSDVDLEVISRVVGSSIRQHWRQVFQIDPYHLDDIRVWESRRSTIVDIYSGYRPPSPCWTDFSLVPRSRDIRMARGRVVDYQFVRNYIADDLDPNREKPTTASISTVDMELGIFKVTYPAFSHLLVGGIFPFAMRGEHNLNPNVNPSGNLIQDHPPRVDHTMDTLISVVWDYDKDGRFDSTQSIDGDGAKYYDYEFDYTTGRDGVAEGPEIEIFSKQEYARFTVDGQIANSSVIEALAKSEAARVYNQFINRAVGYFVASGIIDDVDLNGNMKSIGYTFSKNGVTTSFDLREIPFSPEVAQSLPESARRYLYKQLQRGGP